MTLRPEDWKAWLAGAYFRGYALMKGGRLREADELFRELQQRADEKIPGKVITSRIRRLHGEVLLGLSDARGRDLILRVLHDLGGVNPHIDKGDDEDKERARLASDLCRSLSSIGEHDKAILLMRRVCERVVKDPELEALRWSNLASWYNQRAVVWRAAEDRRRARDDLDFAAKHAADAIVRRDQLKSVLAHDQSLERRECKAIELSIRIERSWLGAADLPDTVNELCDLLRETPDFDSAAETPLQLAYRVGRLGTAHMREKANGAVRSTNLARASSYLRYAWEYSRNVPLRPWLALDLCSALEARHQHDDARVVAEASLRRLEPACGKNYPPNVRLREHCQAIRPRERVSRSKAAKPDAKPIRRRAPRRK